MTHEELLAKIDEPQNWHQQFLVRQALRAVVELHKPFLDKWDNNLRCEHCPDEQGMDALIYPCPTIQAIEKELR